MALLNILHYPDPRLHTRAKPVAQVDDRIRTLIADMGETMYAAHGIGLAATQVNVHERVVVIDLSEEKNQLQAFINPEIVARSEQEEIGEEGCLSVPAVYDKVPRASRPSASTVNGWPLACWRCACNTSLTTWRARCLWNTCRRSSKTASAPN